MFALPARFARSPQRHRGHRGAQSALPGSSPAFLLCVFLAASAHAQFFIGDTAFVPDGRGSLARVVMTTDGEQFYLVSRNGMSRLRTDGTIVDGEPFGIRDLTQPISVAYGRGLVVSTHHSTSAFNANATNATAMTTDGEILWTRMVATREAPVVFDGENFIVVSIEDNVLLARVLGDDGYIRFSRPLAEISDAVRFSAPTVVAAGEGLLALWRQNADVHAVFFDASGPHGDAFQVGSGTMSIGFGTEWNGSFTAASNGSEVMVVWVNRDAPRAWVTAQRIDLAGAPLDGPVTIERGDRLMTIDAVWEGQSYRLAWTRWSSDFASGSIEGASISTSGAVSALETVANDMFTMRPALAVADFRTVVAWNDYTRGGVRGKIVDAPQPFATAADRILATNRADAYAPAVTWTGQHYVTAWQRELQELVFRRLARDGTPVDGEARVIAATGDATLVRVATNGAETAFVWTDGGRVLVVRIDAEGAVLDEAPVVVATGAHSDTADVSTDGRRFLVVWGGPSAVHARRLTARGGFVDGAPLTVARGIASATRVVFDGARFIMGFVTSAGLNATSLTTTGNVAAPVLLADQAAEGYLAVATSGSAHLFASGQTYAVTDEGLGNVRIREGWFASFPDAVWTGGRFMVSTNSALVSVTTDGDVAAVYVPGLLNLREKALAVSGDGTVLLVYTELTRAFRAALHGRFVAPRRRAAAH